LGFHLPLFEHLCPYLMAWMDDFVSIGDSCEKAPVAELAAVEVFAAV
jgi:hypothetical protein